MFVLMVMLTKFETDFGDCFPSPPMIGFLPVYATREDAEKEWPGRPVREIKKEEEDK